MPTTMEATTVPLRVTLKSLRLTRSARLPVRLDRVFISVESQPDFLFSYWNPSYRSMNVGDVFTVDPRVGSQDVDIDAPSLAEAQLTITGAARDWGPGSIRDFWPEGKDTRHGQNILGEHTFEIVTGDCGFDVTYTVERREPG